MLFVNNKKKIAGIEGIERINENTHMVKYIYEDGISDVSIIPNQLDQKEIEELFDYINNPEQLFEIPNRTGELFHGYKQEGPINSLSCLEYNKRLLRYLNLLYKYTEFIRYNVYASAKKSNMPLEEEKLQELNELEQQCNSILETNSNQISPIWNNKSEIPYFGTSLADVYSISYSEYDAQRRMEYCLASGTKSISGLHDYGGLGGPVSYLFISQLYGEAAAEVFKKNSIECSETFEYINTLHKNNK
jgi:hypothetical protein